ncbi:MAG: hypothetical protein JSW51_10835, partial [Gemmatimonadota bacterium]
MKSPCSQIPRRVFLKETSAATLFAGLGMSACMSDAEPAQLTGPRRTLREPGPMLPPVPAILLTVNGKPGEPDEISVVWTFVLNGDPPQVGISVGHEHVAGDLIELNSEFVLNIPTIHIVDQFDVVDMNS